MPDFGFVGDAYTAPSIYQDDQELINWFVEDDPRKEAKTPFGPADRGDYTLYPTPGLLTKCQLAVAPVRGLWVVSGGVKLIAVAGSTVYLVDTSFNATVIGSLATSVGPVSISDNRVSVYIVDGPNRYTYNLTSGVFATLPSTDGAFTGGTVVGIVDNFFVYNQPNSNQWAATDPVSTVTQPLSFASLLGDSVNLVSLICDHREVWLLGETYSEVWVDVGAFPFPFQIVPGTSMQHGCAAPFSVARLGNSFAFVSKDTRGQNIALQMDGYQSQRISTSSVENDLQDDYVADAIGFTYQLRGHEFWVITFPTADKTWVYDATTKFWHKWKSWNNGQFHRHRANCFAFFNNQSIVGDYQNGKLYSLETDLYTDDGQTIRRLRRCPHIISDLVRVYHDDFQIQFQPGVGLSVGQGQNPQAMLRWSNDGGSTWSTEHWTSIGLQGAYKNRAIWRRLGEARDRIYEVVVTDPVKAVIVSANLNAKAGAH
jgi:hypothetical protein